MLQGIVAIVGRPNVGKSTLFNRLTSSRNAITGEEPGITRDRLYGNCYLDKGKKEGCLIIDTGGFESETIKYQPFSSNIVWKQTEQAIKEADLVVLLFDASCGPQLHDKDLIQYLSKNQKDVIYVINKVDGQEKKEAMWEFYEFGLGDLLPISAAFNRNIDGLKDQIKQKLDSRFSKTKVHELTGDVRLAIIGRPNVGKSSLLNRLVGEERSLVSELPGTTRDSVDSRISYFNRSYLLIDTSGIRRRSKIANKIESLSVLRSLESIERADLVVLVIDAREGLTDQETRLANLAIAKFRPVILVVNKWDLVQDKKTNTMKEYEADLKEKLGDISFIPILFISCLENKRVQKTMDLVAEVAGQYEKRVETSELNKVLAKVIAEHTPAISKKYNKRIKFFYATQTSSKPPNIVIFCNLAQEIRDSYVRYMEKKFRELLGFDYIPVKLVLRKKSKENKQGDRHL